MVHIRPVTEADFTAITEIYGHHVLHGLASFETDPPSVTEMIERWRANAVRGLPYLAADLDGRLAGYAYAGPYRHRPAYRFSVENSVYIAPEMTGRGIGRTLLGALIPACEQAGYRQMIAIIGDSANEASIGLHKSLEFELTGTLRGVGFKAGRWVDSVIMQRTLGDGDTTPPDGA